MTPRSWKRGCELILRRALAGDRLVDKQGDRRDGVVGLGAMHAQMIVQVEQPGFEPLIDRPDMFDGQGMQIDHDGLSITEDDEIRLGA